VDIVKIIVLIVHMHMDIMIWNQIHEHLLLIIRQEDVQGVVQEIMKRITINIINL